MAQISPETRQKFVRLVNEEKISQRAAAAACGISHTSGQRILTEVRQAQPQPFSGSGGAANIPQPSWDTDQPPPVVNRPWDKDYHGHTFRALAAPIAFEGFTLRRIRSAIALHRLGNFYESSQLAIAIQSFGPVYAATKQRIAPSLALPRYIKCGNRGLSRRLGEELRAQLVPSKGLMPSIFLPPTIHGAIKFDLIHMGFSVLQHVDGDAHPLTGVRPRFTRRWPTWAVQYYPPRRTFVAMTTDGPVDILNDGKFTLVADEEDPHMFGAIVALGEEAFDGKSTQRARAAWLDKYSNPKLIATMPAGVSPQSPEGKLFEESLSTIRNPDGFGVMPHGASLSFEGLQAEKSSSFKDALDCIWQYTAAIVLGSDGTMTRGTGVYSAPIFAGVRRDLVDRDLTCEVRGINQGHIAPYLRNNYQATIDEAKGWSSPYLEIPLPDPDSDARIASVANRNKMLQEEIEKERVNGFDVTQDRVNQLAESYEVDPPTLKASGDRVSRITLAPTDAAKVVKVIEARASQDLDPLGDDRDEMMLSEMGQKPADDASDKKSDKNDTSTDESNEQKGAQESSSKATQDGGTNTGGETKPGSDGKG